MKQEKQRNEDGEGDNLFKEKRKRTKRKIREKGNNIKKGKKDKRGFGRKNKNDENREVKIIK